MFLCCMHFVVSPLDDDTTNHFEKFITKKWIFRITKKWIFRILAGDYKTGKKASVNHTANT